MSTISEDITAEYDDMPEESATGVVAGDYTYVEGVGNIPRDIFRYVSSDPLGDLPRYSVHIVIQHLMTFFSFLILAATGLSLHYSDLWWAPYMISLFGGVEIARLVHRIAAGIMVVASVYHLVTVIGGTVRKIARKEFDIKRTQIPRLKDLQDLIADLRYFMGKVPYRPKMEKFMYKQKLHYLAILWGSFVLITAGTTLLFPETMANIWPDPRFAQDLARLMHADEALIAVTVVVFWHWSNVHLVPGRFPLQWTFITGRITREHQIEEHFLEYLNNLKEIPEEREYMKEILRQNGFGSKEKGGDSDGGQA
jgi:cytochrome b subunit of formate dehydrogenase